MHTEVRLPRWVGLALAVAGSLALCAEEAAPELRIAPAKVEQLRRMQPLTPDKVQCFVDAGQLDSAQAELVMKSVDREGALALPASAIGSEVPARLDAYGFRRRPDGSLDVLDYIHRDDLRPLPKLSVEEGKALEARVRGFRTAGRTEQEMLLRELSHSGPVVNLIIAGEYGDPVDVRYAQQLWHAVAGPGNPRAAGFIARLHQQLMALSNPVLIPYRTDAGDLYLTRRRGSQYPVRARYTSREMRDIIIDLEDCISLCAGVRAATYLADVYAARYSPDEAPMRDKGRDRHRMVQACGGNREKFDEDEPDTWGSSLKPSERATIAERLVPLLRSDESDCRRVAMNGLLICLQPDGPRLDKRLEDAYKNWPEFERWWPARREELLKER